MIKMWKEMTEVGKCYYVLLDGHTTVHFSNHSAETFLENGIKVLHFPPKLNKTNTNTKSVFWLRFFKLEFKTRFFIFIVIDTLIYHLHTYYTEKNDSLNLLKFLR